MATKHFEYIVNRIAAAKRNADSLASGIGHRGIEGEIREIAARECVEPFLTQSYQCGSGKIIDSFQNLSSQVDLAVYHRKVAPPILISRDLGVYPVECVRYVFEIKTKLTASEIQDANIKFRSVHRLISFPKELPDGRFKGGSLPTTVLFAFGSDIQGSEITRYMRITENGDPPCTVLCVLGKGYWFYNHDTKRWYGIERSEKDPAYAEFAWFVLGLMNTLAKEETSIKPFRPGSYVIKSNTILQPIENESEITGDQIDGSCPN